MLRTTLGLLIVGSLGCALDVNRASDEDPVTDEQSALPKEPLTREPRETAPPCLAQRWDFVISGGDARTCASFARTAWNGVWSTALTYPSAPLEIRNKFCAVTFTSKAGVCNRASATDLNLNCHETASLVARTTATAPPRVTKLGSSPRWSDLDSQAKCPVSTPEVYYNPGLMKSLTYTGGCTSCAVIEGGMLYLTADPELIHQVHVNFNSTITDPPNQIVTLRVENYVGPTVIDVSAYQPTYRSRVMVTY